MTELRIVKSLDKLQVKAVERAVDAFVKECHLEVDPTGFYNYTLETIANFTFGATHNANHFWLVEEDGEVIGYALASVMRDVDNVLTYELKQGWVHPKYRRKQIVKEWYGKFKEKAKECLCQRMSLVSSRNPEAYIRFLNDGWKVHTTILHQEI
jgi:ribosomal protein S18 acetylase RimI-like enzyme